MAVEAGELAVSAGAIEADGVFDNPVSSSGLSTLEATATRRKPSEDALLTSFANRSCSALCMARAVWSSLTLLDAATTASGAPFVTSRGGSLPRWTTTLSIRRLKS